MYDDLATRFDLFGSSPVESVKTRNIKFKPRNVEKNNIEHEYREFVCERNLGGTFVSQIVVPRSFKHYLQVHLPRILPRRGRRVDTARLTYRIVRNIASVSWHNSNLRTWRESLSPARPDAAFNPWRLRVALPRRPVGKPWNELTQKMSSLAVTWPLSVSGSGDRRKRRRGRCSPSPESETRRFRK